MHTELWPPLSLIRTTLGHGGGTDDDGAAASAPAGAPAPHEAGPGPAPRSDASLQLPLVELARRREAVAQRAFPARWAPGRLVSVLHEGRLLGVLLDRCVQDRRWQGWMAAGEADWASAFDVLLEPGDEPFEPAFGLIQTWNPVVLEQTPQLCARVLGEVSATRLAAIRAVHDEWAMRESLAIEPEPGRIALRTAGGVFGVLSGTPLGVDDTDPRAEYQRLYREAAAALAPDPQAAPASLRAAAAPAVPDASAPEGVWARVRRWFAVDAIARPALAALVLVVVVQNAMLLGQPGAAPEDDEVRFRGGPAAPAVVDAAPMADLSLRWKPGTGMADAQALLHAAGAEVVGGPDAQGQWRLRLADLARGQAALTASPLVDAVGPP